MGKFIGKRFNLSSNSYLGFAIISFVLAFICHAKGQEALFKLFANFQFINHSTIIWSIIGLCGIFLLLILFVEGRRKHKFLPETEDNFRRAKIHVENRLKKRKRASFDAIRDLVNKDYSNDFLEKLIDMNPEIFGTCCIKTVNKRKKGITLVPKQDDPLKTT